MAKRIELVFDFVSPNAYMIWWPLRELVQRTGAELDVLPVFLGGMHKLTGNAPPMIPRCRRKGQSGIFDAGNAAVLSPGTISPDLRCTRNFRSIQSRSNACSTLPIRMGAACNL